MYKAWRDGKKGQTDCAGVNQNKNNNKDNMPADTEGLLATLFKASGVKSLLGRYLTKDVADKIKDRKTKLGGTLGDNIISGVENLDSGTGIYASDPEAYDTFKEMFDPVIRDYHKVPKGQKEIKHPAPDFGDIDNLDFGDLDPEGNHIVSTRVRVGRSLDGYSFPPCISNDKRLEMESKVKDVLTTKMPGELQGEYHPLVGMTKETQDKLVADHFLFNDHDRFLKSAGGYNDWPNGRGIYFNKPKNFLVWLNEEDHLRIISMQQKGNLGEVYKRLVTAIKTIENTLPFAHHPNLGYLTFCPTNLGTTLRASVHMRIPNVAALPDFKEICNTMHIQPRGIDGEHTASVGGVYDLSNKRRLGISEYQAVKEMAQGVQVLLLLEKSLEKMKK